MNVVDYKCPNCTATLKFNPTNQKWDCEYCKSSFGLDDLNKNTEEYEYLKTKPLKDLDIYSCKNCGAKIMTDHNTTATFCVYCKSTAIMKDRLQDEYEPDKIIPFKKTKEDAIKAFTDVGIRKILMPKAFSNPKNIEEIRGVYIPFWLFDIECTGKVTSKCTRVTSWSSANYIYTKTDYYDVIRGGEAFFDNIPVDASKNFNDAVMNSIEPYNYKNLQEFNYGYLSGFYAEKYDLKDEEISHIAASRANDTMQNYLRNDMSGYSTNVVTDNSIFCKVEKGQYVLLPVWMLNIKYKDKMRTFAMNGETGKMIGDIPVDKVKAFLLTIGMFIIIFAFTVVILLLGGYRL